MLILKIFDFSKTYVFETVRKHRAPQFIPVNIADSESTQLKFSEKYMLTESAGGCTRGYSRSRPNNLSDLSTTTTVN